MTKGADNVRALNFWGPSRHGTANKAEDASYLANWEPGGQLKDPVPPFQL